VGHTLQQLCTSDPNNLLLIKHKLKPLFATLAKLYINDEILRNEFVGTTDTFQYKDAYTYFIYNGWMNTTFKNDSYVEHRAFLSTFNIPVTQINDSLRLVIPDFLIA
jgi:hypothetical protein